jgi:tryptophan 2,3-dioxygenase
VGRRAAVGWRAVSEFTYSEYLRVDELLRLQDPRSQSAASLTWICEHFFIIAHQSSELYLAQVLLDLDEAAGALVDGRYQDTLECLQRTAAVLDAMSANLEALASMPPSRFAAFRHVLGTASGSQSTQFATLNRLLGLNGGGEIPLMTAMATACDRHGVPLSVLLQPGSAAEPDLVRVALAMLDVARKCWKWQTTHVELVAKMLGHHESGTGGSSGVPYLAKRIAMPFEQLWAVVSAVHHV